MIVTITQMENIDFKHNLNIIKMQFEKHPVEETFKQEIDFSKNPIYAGNYIRTVTGIYINVFNIEQQIDNICIEDIAHALSLQCRFSGHLQSFYSVAQHSINVATMVPNEDKFAALMHDASEAYLVDIPAPIKPELKEYKEIEFRVMGTIAKKYDFEFPFSKNIKEADIKALKIEWDNCMLANNFPFINFTEIKNHFIAKFYEYHEFIRKRY